MSEQRRMQRSNHSKDWSWSFWFTLPLYPYKERRTLRREVVEDTIWTFDQPHGILYAVVSIRMTVVKLEAGGLLVYAPVAPTPECVRLVKELVAKHGDVKYIILPTASGLEHKIFVGPFARKFPNAQIFVAPHQWSFPVNLPLSWLGFPQQRIQTLSEDGPPPAFADEFNYAVLDIDLGPGSFAEVALCHNRSRTLLVTDSILSIPEAPPEIVELDAYPLLFHARDNASEAIQDTPENRRKGWQRIALFAVYFRPSALEAVGWWQTLREALKAPDRSKKAYFGLFPFHWKAGWQHSFAALRGGGRPFVAPILQTLILPQAPKQVIDWADRVASWDFYQIIPCHFDAPIAASPRTFRQAFAFLEKQPAIDSDPENINPLPQEDFEFVRQLETALLERGIVTPPQEKV